MKTADSSLVAQGCSQKMTLYKVMLPVVRALARLLFGLRVEGREYIPQNGGVLICANHMSNWDPVFVASALNKNVHFMAKAELFRLPLLNSMFRSLGAYPVNRGTGDLESVRTTLNFVKNGEDVGIFPQGHRVIGKRPTELPPQNGIGMMAVRSSCDVLPVSIYTKNYRVKIFRKVTVKIGKPVCLADFGETNRCTEDYERVTGAVFDGILDGVKCLSEENK